MRHAQKSAYRLMGGFSPARYIVLVFSRQPVHKIVISWDFHTTTHAVSTLAQFQLRFETNSIVYTMTGQKKDEVFWYFDYFMCYYYFVTYTNSRRRCYFDSSRIEFVIIFSVVWQNSTNSVSVLPAFTRMFNGVLFNIVNSVWLFTDIKIKFQLSNSAWKSWHKMLFPTVRYI